MGAWIETYIARSCISLRLVAPYVGAWIETKEQALLAHTQKSHPTWVRGLKPNPDYDALGFEVSHPTWVRGLKLVYVCKGIV